MKLRYFTHPLANFYYFWDGSDLYYCSINTDEKGKCNPNSLSILERWNLRTLEEQNLGWREVREEELVLML